MSTPFAGGIQMHPLPTVHYRRRTEADDLLAEHEAIHRELDPLKLEGYLVRAIPIEYGQDRVNAETLLKGLRSGVMDAKGIAAVLPYYEKRLKNVPPQTRSMHCPVEVRGAGRSAGFDLTLRCSTPAIDAHGTSVVSTGIRDNRFRSNPLLMWSHDAFSSMFGGIPDLDNIIGRAVRWWSTSAEFMAEVVFDSHEKAQEAKRKSVEGFLNGVSISFQPITWHEEQREMRSITVFDEVELLEISLCSLQSCPEALVVRH